MTTITTNNLQTQVAKTDTTAADKSVTAGDEKQMDTLLKTGDFIKPGDIEKLLPTDSENILSVPGMELDGQYGQALFGSDPLESTTMTFNPESRSQFSITFDNDGNASISGINSGCENGPMEEGQTYELADGSTAKLEDGTLTVTTDDGMTITQTATGNGIDVAATNPDSGENLLSMPGLELDGQYGQGLFGADPLESTTMTFNPESRSQFSITFDNDGNASISGINSGCENGPMEEGQTYELADGSTAKLEDGTLTVTTDDGMSITQTATSNGIDVTATNSDDNGKSIGDPIAANESGQINGGPSFTGGDGGQYSVTGEDGQTYNLLSDTGLAFNGRFELLGGEDTLRPTVEGLPTYLTETGLNVGDGGSNTDCVNFNRDGTATIDGKQMVEGEVYELADGGTAKLEDGQLSISTAEGYTINQTVEGSGDMAYINVDVTTGENGVDGGQLPDGLLGQTFDADNAARSLDIGSGWQILGELPPESIEGYETDGLNTLKETIDLGDIIPPKLDDIIPPKKEVGEWVENEVGEWVENEVGDWVENEVGDWVENEVGDWAENEVGDWAEEIPVREKAVAVRAEEKSLVREEAVAVRAEEKSLVREKAVGVRAEAREAN